MNTMMMMLSVNCFPSSLTSKEFRPILALLHFVQECKYFQLHRSQTNQLQTKFGKKRYSRKIFDYSLYLCWKFLFWADIDIDKKCPHLLLGVLHLNTFKFGGIWDWNVNFILNCVLICIENCVLGRHWHWQEVLCPHLLFKDPAIKSIMRVCGFTTLYGDQNIISVCMCLLCTEQ